MQHTIAVDQIRAGDTIVSRDGTRRYVKVAYLPDWRDGSRCVELAASPDQFASTEAVYFNLSSSVVIEQ